MDIALFIRELLFGHDCVIVPGFGGFIGNYITAHVDKSTDVFSPPVKKISFNRNLSTNDGLLIGKISEAKGIDFNEAKTVVARYVTELHKKLDSGETVVFDHIGTFVNNQEGNVQFEPDCKVNYCLNSFGLETFQCFPLERYDIRKSIIKDTDKDAARKVHLKKMIWRAAVIVPLLAVMVAASLKTNLFKPKVETSTLNPLVAAEFEHNKTVIDKSDLVENISTAESSTQPVIEEVIIPNVQYQIITGSFKSSDNAQKQVDWLVEKGFMPEVIQASNGFFRVCAAEYPDIEAAELKRESILSIFPETWILKK
ncbi:MAG: hypothetical protein LBV26_07260 [Bacteroidales bacterium]|nr:hypothetical protein [Bacteroidales bacterium]